MEKTGVLQYYYWLFSVCNRLPIPKYGTMRLKINLLLFFIGIQLVCARSLSDTLQLGENPTKAEIKAVLDTLEVKVYNDFYSKDYIKVLERGDAALKLANSINDLETNLQFSRFIGSALIMMRDTVRAKNMLLASLEKARSIGDDATLAKATSDLGNMYNEFGDKDRAIDFYERAITLLRNKEDNNQLFILHYNLSEIYLDKGDLAHGEIHVNELSKLIKITEIPIFFSSYELSMAKLSFLKKDMSKAIAHIEESISISTASNHVDNIINSYKTYLKILVTRKDFKKAHEIRQELDKYQDEKIEVERAAAIQGVIARMNVEQYKQELKAQELENELNRQTANRNRIGLYLGIGASLILSFFLSVIMISSKKKKALVVSLQESNVQFLEAKKKAEELSKVKTNFLSAITHELRTPLYGIIGISSILKEDKALEKHKEDITSLKFSADYLLAMVNDLLFLNRLEAFKKQKLEEKVFRPRLLLDNIVNSLEFMRKKNNNTFNICIAADVPEFLKGDYVKLSQILINLVSNACKFTEEGTITVALTSQAIGNEKVSIHFLIADNGLGISKEKQAIIFDEFTQDRKTNVFEGTGLGLSIVKRLLDMHKSTISLKSKENVGTEFQFSIDYPVAEAEEFETVTKTEKMDKHIEGSHILVVDDNKINRVVTQKILERSSYICSTAANGAEAVEIAQKEVFDLILMDVNMPVMDGLQATAAIRKFNTTVPIIALTANDPSQMAKSVEEIGFTDVIIKPYETDYFLEVIKNNFLTTIKV